MKKITAILTLTVLTTLLSFKNEPAEPKYKFEGTLTYWNYKINLLEGIKQTIKNSDIPSRYASAITDSLSALENDIREQITPQLPKPKDSTNKK